MSAIDDIANFLGGSRIEGSSDTSTATIYGKAVSDSENGTVSVVIADDTVSSDGTNVVEIPTTQAVAEGDDVIITLVGGTAKTPVVTGVIGSGDKTEAKVDEVAKHVWIDDEGDLNITAEEGSIEGNNIKITPNGIYNRIGDLTTSSQDEAGFWCWTILKSVGTQEEVVVSQPTSRFGNGSLTLRHLAGKGVLMLRDIFNVGSVRDDSARTQDDKFITPFLTAGSRDITLPSGEPAWSFSFGNRNSLTKPMTMTFGDHLVANEEGQLVIGQYNDDTKQEGAAFVIGNGNKDASLRSNAFTVYKNGTVEASALKLGTYTVPVATVLYDNAAGEAGTVVLSDSVANYQEIEIFFRDSMTVYGSVKLHSPSGKVVGLTTSFVNNGGMQFKTRAVQAIGTTLSTWTDGLGAWNGRALAANGRIDTVVENSIFITRVVGYK